MKIGELQNIEHHLDGKLGRTSASKPEVLNFGLQKMLHARTFDVLLDLARSFILREAGIYCSKYMHSVTSLVLRWFERLINRNEHISHCLPRRSKRLQVSFLKEN